LGNPSKLFHFFAFSLSFSIFFLYNLPIQP